MTVPRTGRPAKSALGLAAPALPAAQPVPAASAANSFGMTAVVSTAQPAGGNQAVFDRNGRLNPNIRSAP
jgi:hypothetical protein